MKAHPELKALQRWKNLQSILILWYFTNFISQAMLPSASHFGKNMFPLMTVEVDPYRISVTPKNASLSGSESVEHSTDANSARSIWEIDSQTKGRKYHRPFLFPQSQFPGASLRYVLKHWVWSQWFKCIFCTTQKPLNTSLLLYRMFNRIYSNCSKSRGNMGCV